MKDHGLGREQLFSLKRVTLEKRIKLFFKETKDSNSAIEMLVALQIRDELCEDDFSFMLVSIFFFVHDRMRFCAGITFISWNILIRRNGVCC